ncbi:MAG: SDR family oxidoreductase [Janthinobacterium lividum]
MKVVVLGGSGTLGRALVARLRARGVDVLAASRRTGVDLVSGNGLTEALDGADTVVHAASNPLRPKRVDLQGTRRLIDTVRRSAVPAHVVYVSIVGCDANPYPYYRVKHACEQLLGADDELPVTVVRATQFHSLVATIARSARPLGTGITIRDLAVQPCDVGYVADRLDEIATTPPPAGFSRHDDLAGPERLTLAEGVAALATHDGVRLRRRITLPALGNVARAFAAGTQLAGPDAELGGRTFTDWLAALPPRPRTGRRDPRSPARRQPLPSSVLTPGGAGGLLLP